MIKKRLLAVIVISIVAITLSSCANWQLRKDMMVEKFYGKHVDEAIRYFGVPTGRIFTSDGGQVIEFVTYRNGYRCEDQFTTDSRGIIISSRHGGQNGCVTPF
jgi:hypothetical protein